MRHSATRSLLERDDVIIVASVSCIYGLGSVEAYSKMTITLKKNNEYDRDQLIRTFITLQYKRNDQNFFRGTFRVRGENLEANSPLVRKKLEGGIKFKIKSSFQPAGDQPEAIKKILKNLKDKQNEQVLLGVTGSGKTFTMAKVIEATNRPALVLAPNKTLAAQLYGEFKSFFPDNAVEYFVIINIKCKIFTKKKLKI